MSKINIDLTSTMVEGRHSVVDIIVNNTVIQSNVQLSSEVLSLTYDVDLLPEINKLNIRLLNDLAVDSNNDGDYDDTEDQTMQAMVTSLEISYDNTNFLTLIPQIEEYHVVPVGENMGANILLTHDIQKFTSFGYNDNIEFDNLGLLNNNYLSAYNVRIIDGVYYDANGNVIPN